MMNITVIITSIIVMFLVFGFLAFGILFISPLTFIGEYPPDIQAAYYRTQHKEAAKKNLTTLMRIKKAITLIIYMFVFAWMLHIAGHRLFCRAYC